MASSMWKKPLEHGLKAVCYDYVQKNQLKKATADDFVSFALDGLSVDKVENKLDQRVDRAQNLWDQRFLELATHAFEKFGNAAPGLINALLKFLVSNKPDIPPINQFLLQTYVGVGEWANEHIKNPEAAREFTIGAFYQIHDLFFLPRIKKTRFLIGTIECDNELLAQINRIDDALLQITLVNADVIIAIRPSFMEFLKTNIMPKMMEPEAAWQLAPTSNPIYQWAKDREWGVAASQFAESVIQILFKLSMKLNQPYSSKAQDALRSAVDQIAKDLKFPGHEAIAKEFMTFYEKLRVQQQEKKEEKLVKQPPRA